MHQRLGSMSIDAWGGRPCGCSVSAAAQSSANVDAGTIGWHDARYKALLQGLIDARAGSGGPLRSCRPSSSSGPGTEPLAKGRGLDLSAICPDPVPLGPKPRDRAVPIPLHHRADQCSRACTK